MSNDAYLTLQGWVGSEVQLKQLDGGPAVASFRIGSTARTFDRGRNAWVDRPTTWFTVECWRTLAQNVAESINRGDPIVVHGRLRTNEWTENDEPRSRTILEALSVGHDLARGITTFRRPAPKSLGAPDDLPPHADDEPNPFSAHEAA